MIKKLKKSKKSKSAKEKLQNWLIIVILSQFVLGSKFDLGIKILQFQTNSLP